MLAARSGCAPPRTPQQQRRRYRAAPPRAAAGAALPLWGPAAAPPRCRLPSPARASNSGGSSGTDANDADDGDGGAFGDKWEDVLSVHHTLSSLYAPKVELRPHQQVDHAARRRARELDEIAAAGKRLGLTRERLEANVAALAALVPGLAPNLDRMKASQW